MSAHARLTACLAVLVLVASSVACSSGSSGPTAPASSATGQVTTGMTVSTALGVLPVVDHGCGAALDLNRIGREIDTTARIAERQNSSLLQTARLDGFEIHTRTAGEAQERCSGNAACFEPAGASGRLHVICDGGGVEHETAHAVGWAGDLSCWQTVYHSRNFRCEKTDNLYGA